MATLFNNVINFVVENWYWFVVLVPSTLWAAFCIVWGGFCTGWWLKEYTDPLWRYRNFWRFCVKLDGVLSDWGWKGVLRKIATLINLVTLFWAWGYVAMLIFAAVGFIARWSWKGIKALFGGLGHLISNCWKAL